MVQQRNPLAESMAAFLRAFRARPWLAFLSACLAVTILSWWGMLNFADRLLAGLPEHANTAGVVPLSDDQLARQIAETQRLNAAIRAERSNAAGAGMSQVRAPIAVESGAPAVGPVDPTAHGPSPGLFTPIDKPAEALGTIEPEMPELARESGAQSTVVVQALVGTDGTVLEARVLNPNPTLNEAAEAAVRRMRFRPATAGGVPVASWTSVTLHFRR